MNLNLINILNETSEEGFDFFSTPRIIAYCALGIAFICVSIIVIKYFLVDRHKKVTLNDENKTVIKSEKEEKHDNNIKNSSKKDETSKN